MWGEPDGLVQVFTRLLDNAVKFTHNHKRHGGTVKVSLGGDGDRVHVKFIDEGIGFPSQVTSQLFDLFFQYNRDLFEQQGAGMGLTIARSLVNLHQGTIEVVSEEGVGSKFTIILPAYAEGTAVANYDGTQDGRKNATVLVVEDDPHLLLGLQELLEISDGDYQLQVLTATNGVEGLNMLSCYRPNLIVSDIMMPEMGGYEFLHRVRENPEWLQIPFIFLTARGERRDIHRGWRSGVEEYITKPYDSDQLLELIDTQINRHFKIQGVMVQNFDALKRSILNLITPDFRLPLSSVAQYSDKLVEGLENIQTEEALKESLQGIRASSVHLTRLVEDFIILAELRTGEAEAAFSLRAEPIIALGMTWYEIAQSHQSKTKVLIHCPLKLDLPCVYGDSTVLANSLKRFVQTGVTYCRANGGTDLHLDIGLVDDEVHLTLRFSGSLPNGDTAEFWTQADNVVGEYQIDPTIMIIKGYVALHDGRINLNTDEQQTTLIIILPVYENGALVTAVVD